MKVKDLVNIIDAHVPYFQEKWEKGRENLRIKRGEAWDEKEKRKIKSQGRQPYSFSAITNKLNIMSSAFRQSKTQWDVMAKNDPNDEIKAEMAGIILRDVERQNKFDYKQNDLFEDMKDILWCASEHSWVNGKEVITKLDPFLTMWDSNSTDYDRDDSLFTAKVDFHYRYQIRDKWGDFESSVDWGKNKSFFLQRSVGNKDLDKVAVITMYLRVMRDCHYVVFEDSEGYYGDSIVRKFQSKEKAERELRRLNVPYLMNGLQDEGKVVTRKEEKIDKYVFHYGDILEYERTDYSKSPIKFGYAFQADTEVWTMMDLLKDPQKFMDRLYSQVDFAMGKDIKKLYELRPDYLADGQSIEDAVSKITSTGGVLKSNAPPGQSVIQELVGKGINPQWIAVIDKMQSYLEDFAGGRNFQGLSEGSGESGRAINLKQMAGQMVVYYLITNFSRFKQNLGEGILSDLQKYDSEERMIKVMGGQLTPEMMQILQQNGITVEKSYLNDDEAYVAMNENGIPFLRDAELELVVTEAELSNTEKEMNFMRLMEAGRHSPVLPYLPTYNKLLLENDPNIKYRDRMQLIRELEMFNQAKQQEEQENRNINKAKVLSNMKDEREQSK